MTTAVVVLVLAGVLLALGAGGTEADRRAARSRAWERYELLAR